MIELEIEDGPKIEISAERIREQLDLLVRDHAFCSSKRSVAFLRYVVEQTLNGSADQIKERTIGVEVFERVPSYDTNLDHVVRTAATELRKRLAIYYGEERHRSELRIGLTPGSYIPRFTLPAYARISVAESELAMEPAVLSPDVPQTNIERQPEFHPDKIAATPAIDPRRFRFRWIYAVAVLLAIAGIVRYGLFHRESAQDLFWKPVLETPGSVLLAVGDVPNGPPLSAVAGADGDFPMPVLATATSTTVPFADAVTIARVVGTLEASGKKVIIRRESASYFLRSARGAGGFNRRIQ